MTEHGRIEAKPGERALAAPAFLAACETEIETVRLTDMTLRRIVKELTRTHA